jgi:DUF1680 family protein
MLDSTPRVVDTSRSRYTKLRPLSLTDVRLSDGFWETRRRLNRETTLPSQFEYLEETGRLDNFRRASGKIQAPFRGLYFNDSDVYKWLEAASWSFATHHDPELARMVDAVAVPDNGWEDRLYRTGYPRGSGIRPATTALTAVPYYAWANREPGAMRVWLKTGDPPAG